MIVNLLAASASSTTAVTSNFRASARSFNGILIAATVGGSGHAATDWDAHILNVTLKSGIEGVPDIQIAKNLRVGDALEFSDYIGGFSEALEGTDGTVYAAFLPIGRVVMRGDDQLEGSLYLPGDASATYAYRISLVDIQAGPEVIQWYESITGNGDDWVRKNVQAIYYKTAAAGSTLTVRDQARTFNVTDHDVLALGNAAGSMEAWETFGQLWSDVTGFTQDVAFNIPSSSKALVNGRFFSLQRMNERSENEAIGIEQVRSQIENENPEKAAVLQALGLF